MKNFSLLVFIFVYILLFILFIYLLILQYSPRCIDLDLHCLPLNMWIYSNNPDQAI